MEEKRKKLAKLLLIESFYSIPMSTSRALVNPFGFRRKKETTSHSLVQLETGQRLSNGQVPVQAEADQGHGAEVEGKGSDEHEQLAHDIAGQPLARDPPANLQGHDYKGHDQVGNGQMHDHDVNVVSSSMLILRTDMLKEGLDFISSGGNEFFTHVARPGRFGLARFCSPFN